MDKFHTNDQYCARCGKKLGQIYYHSDEGYLCQGCVLASFKYDHTQPLAETEVANAARYIIEVPQIEIVIRDSKTNAVLKTAKVPISAGRITVYIEKDITKSYLICGTKGE